MKPLTSATPHAVIMVGIPGSGKSAFAERFSQTFQAPLVSQTSLEKKYGLTEANARALQLDILKEFLKTNKTVLIDGGFALRAKRLELYKFLSKAGYKPFTVWVQTDPKEARFRAAKAYPKGSGLTEDEFDVLVKKFQAPTATEKPIVISGKHTYATQLKVVLKQLSLAAERPDLPEEKPVRPRGRQVVIR